MIADAKQRTRTGCEPKVRNPHISANHPLQRWLSWTLSKSTALRLRPVSNLS